jgi:hypothetical protein
MFPFRSQFEDRFVYHGWDWDSPGYGRPTLLQLLDALPSAPDFLAQRFGHAPKQNSPVRGCSVFPFSKPATLNKKRFCDSVLLQTSPRKKTFDIPALLPAPAVDLTDLTARPSFRSSTI